MLTKKRGPLPRQDGPLQMWPCEAAGRESSRWAKARPPLSDDNNDSANSASTVCCVQSVDRGPVEWWMRWSCTRVSAARVSCRSSSALWSSPAVDARYSLTTPPPPPPPTTGCSRGGRPPSTSTNSQSSTRTCITLFITHKCLNCYHFTTLHLKGRTTRKVIVGRHCRSSS